MERGRASHGGDFLRLDHVPQMVSFRHHPGPLRDVNAEKLIERWLKEMELELLEKETP